MSVTAPSFDEIVANLRRANVALDPEGQRHALTLLRTLAEGGPVATTALAERTGRTPAEAARFVDGLPGVYRDDAGDVVGFWGLAATEFPPHRYRLDGRDLWTWCAWDPFILTRWLGGRAEVASIDARTGEAVSFRIEDGHARDLSHPELVLSFKQMGEWSADVIASFCHFVHFFTDQDNAEAWTAEHDGTFVVSLDDAVRLGEVWGELVFPDLDPDA
jgi:alkylmercury lyase